MSRPSEEQPRKRGKKVRVAMRRNRARRARTSDWTRQAREAEGHEFDAETRESVVAKGDLSRRRTIIVDEPDDPTADRGTPGTVVSVLGLYTEVDDGRRIVHCSVPRVLRTVRIEDRHPVTVGDRVRFRVCETTGGQMPEGVIESVEPRRGLLQRRVGTRLQTVVANVDQAIIVSSAGQPPPKPNLIDRYIVSALTGDITPVICMNKMDLDADGAGAMILERYRALGYETLATSTERGDGIDDLRGKLTGKASVVAGQSGVGKSSLLNAVQPRLELKVGAVTRDTHKGRHTTTTAGLIRLDFGGYVVDTPGVRSFELARVERFQLEGYFVEFVPRVRDCKFSNCTHVHEIGCAVKAAVDAGEIHVERYESYVRLFEEGNEDAPSARR